MEDKKFYPNFQSREDLKQYGKESLLLYALELRYNIDDIHTLAADSITDGSDDKKMDMVLIDEDNGRVIIAQSYISEDVSKDAAKENKAADLNTAASWLFAMSEDDLSDRVKSHVLEVRRLLEEDKISEILFWYSHNLPESKNVQDALKSVEQTASALLESNFPGTDISIAALEIGVNSIEEYYVSKTTPILVSNTFEVDILGGYEVSASKWQAFVTTVDAQWLYNIYQEHSTQLFSANIRDYLGSRKTDKNINNGIKNTVGSEADQFWVYNNGITALVNNYDITDITSNKLGIVGLSIVNGAQTTGAIGTEDNSPENVKIPIRFIKCDDQNTVLSIIKFNNSQNKIHASDFRSNDPAQVRLMNEFNKNTDFEYALRRGGSDDVIRRPANFLSAAVVAQALAAFFVKPRMAYHQKNKIWEIDKFYNFVFNDSSNYGNVLFSYSLLKTIEKVKKDLVSKSSRDELKSIEEQHLDYLRQRGSIFLFMSAISASLETILDSKIANKSNLKFKQISDIDSLIDNWQPIVDSTLPYTGQLIESLNDGIRSDETVNNAINKFVSMVESTSSVLKSQYSDFADEIEQ